ncbi:Glutathione S-transferase 2 [Coniosporium apollinis]|uniref:Glutathione S-transferase 2 n=2 Tax=Coniosporium TaxID=2810619 RepID=A0ABQ9NN88_9PEZI|nr:Glutathione S-transferase 2 [Cladosporium sp. JES 115]KAJ9657113.1 Glutathione S-transferase 2 [Coniosporium apollinis]
MPQQDDSNSTSGIQLYTAGTPNGHKINILVEELGVDYTVHKIDIAKNVQKEDWFLKINPNGRIPAIVDKNEGRNKRVFEGGAIMLYLCERYDKEHKISFPYDSDDYWEMVEWIIWMQSGIGPMQVSRHTLSTTQHQLELTTNKPKQQGQANHFYRYAPTKISYAIERYQTETKRLYRVLEDRLVSRAPDSDGNQWLVGGKYTIADLASFSWVNWAEWAGVDTKPFPKVEKWVQAIASRPATQKGVNIPEKFEMKEAMKTKAGEEEYAKHHSNWVMRGMEEESGKH